MPKLAFNIPQFEGSLIKQALSGAQGEVLIEIITDKIVLNESLSPKESKGAGYVLSFLRSMKEEKNIQPTKE